MYKVTTALQNKIAVLNCKDRSARQHSLLYVDRKNDKLPDCTVREPLKINKYWLLLHIDISISKIINSFQRSCLVK